eukprot:Sdes_comp18694_c0_seq1m8986
MDPQKMKEAIEKARRFAELQAKIQQRAMNIPLMKSAPPISTSPSQNVAPTQPTSRAPQQAKETFAPSIIINEMGKVVDSSGKEVFIPKLQPSVKANMRVKKTKMSSDSSKQQNFTAEEDEEKANPYFDARLSAGGKSDRCKKAFQFVEPGKYINIAQKLRAQNQLEKLQQDIAAATKKSGISSVTKLALLSTNKDDSSRLPIPEFEWWDLMIFDKKKHQDFIHENCLENITHLVEHPVIFEEQDSETNKTIPVYLTKKEIKKIRSQRRREIEKEKQEQIRAGLLQPEAPKLKLSNFMRALKDEAIQDPSKIEMQVRQQMQERKERHENANSSRQLTAEEKKEKKRKKLTEANATEIFSAIYRLPLLNNPKHKFKLEKTCQDYNFTGCGIILDNTNVIIVEGGPKGIKKFKNLMLRRINWKEDIRGNVSSHENFSSPHIHGCSLVWEGIVSLRHFNQWKFKPCLNEIVARDFLRRYGVEHYWDIALGQTILEESEFS